MRVRVVVWNVHGFRAGTRPIGEAIRAFDADLLILNETGYVGFRLGRLAGRLGMARADGTGFFRPIPNAVLVRPPWRIVEAEKVVFPRTRRTIRRGAVLATVGRAGRRLLVAGVHLGLSGAERAEHARVLTDLLVGRGAVILGGDFNEGPDGPAANWIAGRFWDVCGDGCGPTFPSADPRARIDYLFVSERVGAASASVGSSNLAGLSDHLPVIADLEVR
jgi:endonuclease/exonuclease/phosphatase family metal-dependent hydrolase